MAVTTEFTVPQTNRKVYSGLSSDSKPADPVASSVFFETDTGDLYEYDGSAWGIKQSVVTDGNLTPIEYGQKTTSDGVLVYIWAAASSPTKSTIFGATLPTGAKVALIQALNENVRWRDDGTNPTATVGMQLAAGDQFLYTGDLDNLRFMPESSSPIVNAELNVTLYG